ncbi:thymidylate synthase [Afipia broomeae]|uniref:Thymidylate synthase/dCMP hydroxymethylase domain-containing protein n=1 Tax=Afipia broomeae ATCC 49717 TaxID=883078 RepID=K8PK04_9BRAD|nr:thymidylate synthase [Afipia broomeae]EKS39845.1 hypothetical protein HMPREF9695_01806 [Afipia broomeae ATCC 49717]
MEIVQETLDDVLRKLYPSLLTQSASVAASRGKTVEAIGVLLEITKPRARLSRTETRGKPFSSLGELLWYFSRNNRLDFVAYYIPRYEQESDDGVTVHGGYGRRLFRHRNIDQIQNVLGLLHARPQTRRAVIQLFDAEDLTANFKEIPCTTTLQFFIRDNRFDMVVTMRSNDAYKGLPHDVFCFTMLQEIMARSLDCELGTYKHFVGSMHLYESDFSGAKLYIDEAVQPRIEMPPMPIGDPWPSLRILSEAEERVRTGEQLTASSLPIDEYWRDLVRLLQIFRATGDEAQIADLKESMAFKRYSVYVDTRVSMKPRKRRQSAQPTLFEPRDN